MARRPKGSPPSYCLHKQSGQACFNWPLGGGRYKTILLGRHGAAESHAEYGRVLAEWRQAAGKPPDLTVAELLLRFWSHATRYYRLADGSPSRELNHFHLALQPVLDLYGDAPAAEFGPLKLKAVRRRMLDARQYRVRRAGVPPGKCRWVGESHVRLGEGEAELDGKWAAAEMLGSRQALSRKVVNQRVDHIKRVFRWAVSEELVPSSVSRALESVAGLRRGQEGARERPKVQSVPDEVVEKTLPHLRPQVATMVRLQRLTGARPSEVLGMRGRFLDRTGPVWWYRIDPNIVAREGQPANLHKTAHVENANGGATVKVLPLGPRAQAVLRPWLKEDPDAYLFSAAEARAAQDAERRASRRTPLWRSHQRAQAAKRKAVPGRAPRRCYDRHSYAQAVRRACVKAGVPHWHPHQLKHTAATEVRRRYGAEAAQGFVGHSKLSTTELYAEKNMALVERIALEIG